MSLEDRVKHVEEDVRGWRETFNNLSEMMKFVTKRANDDELHKKIDKMLYLLEKNSEDSTELKKDVKQLNVELSLVQKQMSLLQRTVEDNDKATRVLNAKVENCLNKQDEAQNQLGLILNHGMDIEEKIDIMKEDSRLYQEELNIQMRTIEEDLSQTTEKLADFGHKLKEIESITEKDEILKNHLEELLKNNRNNVLSIQACLRECTSVKKDLEQQIGEMVQNVTKTQGSLITALRRFAENSLRQAEELNKIMNNSAEKEGCDAGKAEPKDFQNRRTGYSDF